METTPTDPRPVVLLHPAWLTPETKALIEQAGYAVIAVTPEGVKVLPLASNLR